MLQNLQIAIVAKIFENISNWMTEKSKIRKTKKMTEKSEKNSNSRFDRKLWKKLLLRYCFKNLIWEAFLSQSPIYCIIYKKNYPTCCYGQRRGAEWKQTSCVLQKSNLYYTRLIPFRVSRVSGAHLRGFAG